MATLVKALLNLPLSSYQGSDFQTVNQSSLHVLGSWSIPLRISASSFGVVEAKKLARAGAYNWYN